jgi:polysaccharide deacetylase family protein (PEP-CTERM system associated)
MPNTPTAVFLFSVDLEDVRMTIANGDRYREAVPRNVARYLEFLDRHAMRCTFFTVGDIARRYPQLVRELIGAGHEVACHTSDHVPLDRHDPESFREDLQRNLDDLRKAGADDVCGFRAPTLSLTEQSRWAYDVLAESGFRYSSSVLPARNPLYGWPGFPEEATLTDSGIWEIPVSLSKLPGLNVPFGAGVYFRVLPFVLVRRLFERTFAEGRPVVGYFHPYDIDTEQEHFMHAGLGDSRFYNWLMYRNRKGVIPRLESLVSGGRPVFPYADYVSRVLSGGAA